MNHHHGHQHCHDDDHNCHHHQRFMGDVHRVHTWWWNICFPHSNLHQCVGYTSRIGVSGYLGKVHSSVWYQDLDTKIIWKANSTLHCRIPSEYNSLCGIRISQKGFSCTAGDGVLGYICCESINLKWNKWWSDKVETQSDNDPFKRKALPRCRVYAAIIIIANIMIVIIITRPWPAFSRQSQGGLWTGKLLALRLRRSARSENLPTF